jgi:proteasome lid subunit RPN8/RPN11
VKIAADILRRIEAHGKRSYRDECCGFLLGKVADSTKTVEDILEVENERKDERQSRFLISPEAYVKADQEARRGGLEILGFYHSHPDHPARPSQYDLEHAWGWFSYMITRVEKGEPKETTSWVLREDRSAFDQEEIEELVVAQN